MIKSLTSEQIARLPEFAEKWIKIGRSVEPADRYRAEHAILSIFKAEGISPPRKILWFSNPNQMLNEFAKTGNKAVFGNAVSEVVMDISEAFGEGSDVWAQIVGGLAGARLAIWEGVCFPPHAAVWRPVQNMWHGAHDAWVMAPFDFCREVLGLVKETDPLVGFFEIAQSCGWFIPCEDVCFASERPNVLKLNASGKIHSDNGPAVVFPDGWKVFARDGKFKK